MIEAVLSHYGADLTRVHGDGWRSIKCPFHDDHTASASVSLGRGAFVCHGCHVKGDAFSLIMQQEGIGFVEAIGIAESITGESHADLRRPASGDTPRKRSKWRDTLFEGARD